MQIVPFIYITTLTLGMAAEARGEAANQPGSAPAAPGSQPVFAPATPYDPWTGQPNVPPNASSPDDRLTRDTAYG